MATAGESFKLSATSNSMYELTENESLSKATDMIYDFSCSPCTENKKNAEALYKCVDCQTLLCVKCCDGHVQFVKGHKIVDVKAKDGGSIVKQVKGYMCKEHQGKLVDMYCKWHDKVCCSVCILKHRYCIGVSYIPDVANRLLQAHNKDEIKESLKSQCTMLRKLKSNMITYLNKLPNEKDAMIKDIQQLKEKIIAKVEELEESSLIEVEKKYQAISDDVNREVQNMDQLLNETETFLSKIDKDNFDDDMEKVVTFGLSKQHLSMGKEHLMDYKWKAVEQVNFQQKTWINKCLMAEKFGHVHVSSRLLNSAFVRNYMGGIINDGTFIINELRSGLHDVGIYTSTSYELYPHDVLDNTYVPMIFVIEKGEQLKNAFQMLRKMKDERCPKVLLCLLRKERKDQSFLGSLFAANYCLSKHEVEETCKDKDISYVCLNMDSESYDQEKSKVFQMIRDILLA